MQNFNFNYSLKNIPTPTKTLYQLMLMEEIESVIKQIRWNVHFYLKKDTSNIAYTNHGFKTRNYPPQCKELQNFEKDLLDTTKLIKFLIVKDSFQRKLNEDILNIKSSPNFMPLLTRLLTSVNYLHRIIQSHYMKISPNPIKNHQPIWKNL